MAVPAVVLIAATVVLFVSRQETDAALAAERHEAALRDAFGRVLVDLTDAEAAIRGYVLTGEPSFLAPYTLGQAAFPGDMQALTELTRTNTVDAEVAAKLQSLANERLSLLQTTRLMVGIDDLKNRTQLTELMDAGQGVMSEIRSLVGQEEAKGARALAERQQHLDAAAVLHRALGTLPAHGAGLAVGGRIRPGRLP